VDWRVVFDAVQSIARGSADLPRAMVTLRKEVIATRQVPEAEKAEMHELMDGLQDANLYGRIALVGRLKEVLSRHPEFKSHSAEFTMRRDSE
jgi:hypothetical protein